MFAELALPVAELALPVADLALPVVELALPVVELALPGCFSLEGALGGVGLVSGAISRMVASNMLSMAEYRASKSPLRISSLRGEEASSGRGAGPV